MSKIRFTAWYRYAKPVWGWLFLGFFCVIFLPMLPFVSLGQGGAMLVGAVIIAELYLGKIRFEWTKVIELSVARAADLHVICEFGDDGKLTRIGAAELDPRADFPQYTDDTYATIRTENDYVAPHVLGELIEEDEYTAALTLKTPHPRIRAWVYHQTLNRLNGRVEYAIVAGALFGTAFWAFGDQLAQWIFCQW